MKSYYIFTHQESLYPGPLAAGLTGKSLEQGNFNLQPLRLYDFATKVTEHIDDAPYGGGPGMILKAPFMEKAMNHMSQRIPGFSKFRKIHFSPAGKALTQAMIQDYAQENQLILLASRFEGVDQRIIEYYEFEEVSTGDFVMTNGDLPCLCFLDAIIRLGEKTLGNQDSISCDSFSSGLLEYPQYTRPQEWMGLSVPKDLTNGDHSKINAWRISESLNRTRTVRPDLWVSYQEKMKTKKD